MVVRICLIAALVAVLLSGAGPAVADPPVVPPPLNFIINRDRNPIGTHRFTFHAEGDRLIVDIAIDVEVKLAFITVYTYTLRAREVWQDNRLISFDSDTDDNGTNFKVRVRAAADGLHVEGKDSSYTAPSGAMTDSYWRAAMVNQTQFIDIEDGHLIELRSEPAGRRPIAVLGRMVDTDVYTLSGELEGELGYTPAGEWTLLRFKSHGSDILYTRAP